MNQGTTRGHTASPTRPARPTVVFAAAATLVLLGPQWAGAEPLGLRATTAALGRPLLASSLAGPAAQDAPGLQAAGDDKQPAGPAAAADMQGAAAPLANTAASTAGATARPAPVLFVIEKIVVTGVKHGSEQIVVSESLLTPGSAYSESQLRDALQRVERLPFVVNADFSLRKGTSRGLHELVITVTETRPVFFGGELSWVASGFTPAEVGISWNGTAAPELGVRKFFKGYSELSATARSIKALNVNQGTHIGDTEFRYELAYRHHNLFGRHLVGTLFFRAGRFDGRQGGVELAVPLSATNVLLGTFQHQSSDAETVSGPIVASLRFRPSVRSEENSASMAWLRDTTDDPFAPRHGGRLQATGSLSQSDSVHQSFHDPTTSVWPPIDQWTDKWTAEADSRALGGQLAASRYWPLAARLALGVSAHGRVSRANTDGTVMREQVLAHTIGGRTTAQGGDLEVELLGMLPRWRIGTCWWSLRAALAGSRTRSRSDPPQLSYVTSGTPTPSDEFNSSYVGVDVTASLSARGRWGTARLTLGYYDDLRMRTTVLVR